MRLPHLPTRPLPLGYRLLCIGLILCFVVIGLIGVVLPIIPGIIFLFAAAYLVTRVSRRGAAYFNGKSWYRENTRSLDAAGRLKCSDRLRLLGLMTARGLVAASASVVGMIRRRRA
jgi:uncharacterized membrane protein YbaN (DUF454 family)